MIAFDLWLGYVATILVLMSTPGPSQLLMLSNSLRHGFAPSLATAAGDLSANTLQILAAGFGLGALIHASETAFLTVKWLGVAYLVYMGLRLILASPVQTPEGAPSRRSLFLQGFVTSAANPKAVVFFAALFPQFLTPADPILPQLVALGGTYILIDGTFLTVYGATAGWFGRRIGVGARVWTNRVSGGLLIGAAVLLGAKDLRR